MTNQERAAEHATAAEEVLAKATSPKRKQPNVYGADAQIAAAHAALALYYQKAGD